MSINSMRQEGSSKRRCPRHLEATPGRKQTGVRSLPRGQQRSAWWAAFWRAGMIVAVAFGAHWGGAELSSRGQMTAATLQLAVLHTRTADRGQIAQSAGWANQLRADGEAVVIDSWAVELQALKDRQVAKVGVGVAVGGAANSPFGRCVRWNENRDSYAGGWPTGTGDGGAAYQFEPVTWAYWAARAGVPVGLWVRGVGLEASPAQQDAVFNAAVAGGGASAWSEDRACTGLSTGS